MEQFLRLIGQNFVDQLLFAPEAFGRGLRELFSEFGVLSTKHFHCFEGGFGIDYLTSVYPPCERVHPLDIPDGLENGEFEFVEILADCNLVAL